MELSDEELQQFLVAKRFHLVASDVDLLVARVRAAPE
jgi:hypothetical protein